MQKLVSPALDAFFEKWTADTIAWYEKMQAEYRELGYKAFYDKYNLMSGFPDLSKGAVELICRTHLRPLPNCGKSVQEIVERDMEDKKAKLLAKVSAKVGEITEVDLHNGDDGTPNGYVAGTKGTAYVSTIIAGGYNIQCLHYRVLVK